jgi:NADPH:quinone reductase-like Zn-dependent oxidoreductase
MGTRIEFDHYGDPSVLRVASFEPDAPAAHQVLIRNEAVGVNPFDYKFVAGATGGKPLTGPVVPGNEGAGVVEAVGPEVTGFSVGDEVVWRGYLGGFATHTVVAASKVHAKPASLSFAEAAALPVAAGTAWAAVKQAGVEPGDVLLVHAASGGVGSAAVQIAVALGARVIGTASAKNQDYVRSLGAEPVIYGPGLVDAVRALGQVTAIVDAVGTVDAVAASRELLPGLDRAISTANAEGFTAVKSEAEAVPSVLALAARGLLRADVTRSFALSAAAEALELSKTGHVRGKIVLLP